MLYIATVNGKKYEVNVERAQNGAAQEAPAANMPVSASEKPVTCPLPGTIMEILVEVGQKVTKGQTLLILEALKMENEISAPCDGIVKQIPVSNGSHVETDTPLIILG